jgi:hypothetical protein
MISEEKLRKKLQSIFKQKPPAIPRSFAEADLLIDEIVEAARVSRLKTAGKKVKQVVGRQ